MNQKSLVGDRIRTTIFDPNGSGYAPGDVFTVTFCYADGDVEIRDKHGDVRDLRSGTFEKESAVTGPLGIVMGSVAPQRTPTPTGRTITYYRMTFLVPTVCDAKISAIKTLRDHDKNLGLKEAKDLIEGAIPMIGNFNTVQEGIDYLLGLNNKLASEAIRLRTPPPGIMASDYRPRLDGYQIGLIGYEPVTVTLPY